MNMNFMRMGGLFKMDFKDCRRSIKMENYIKQIQKICKCCDKNRVIVEGYDMNGDGEIYTLVCLECGNVLEIRIGGVDYEELENLKDNHPDELAKLDLKKIYGED